MTSVAAAAISQSVTLYVPGAQPMALGQGQPSAGPRIDPDALGPTGVGRSILDAQVTSERRPLFTS